MQARQTFPWLTLLVAGMAVIVSLVPAASRQLIFNRDAIAAGQWWRLVTGNFVHCTPRHLWFDVLAVALAGVLIETRSRARLASLTCASAAAVGLVVFIACPNVQLYSGLSGVAFALYGYLVVRGIIADGAGRWICLAALVVIAGKIAFEHSTNRALLVPVDGTIVLPAAHVAGAICGAIRGVIPA